jgi:hypothetical protein
MLDYARQRAIEALRPIHRVILATSGPAGVQAGEFFCQTIELEIYLLLPRTSDHLFNLEQGSTVILLTEGWELRGEAQITTANPPSPNFELLRAPEAQLCQLVRVNPCRIHIRKKRGWGYLETIDLKYG